MTCGQIEAMNKLEGVHPELVEKVGRIVAAMLSLGFPMMVTDGARTAEQQHQLWRQGRDLPGKWRSLCITAS
jgi:hypothetical protein